MRVADVVVHHVYSDVRNAQSDSHRMNVYAFHSQDDARAWMCEEIVTLIHARVNDTWARIERRGQGQYFNWDPQHKYTLSETVRNDLEKLMDLADAWRHGEHVPWLWDLALVEVPIR